MKNDISQENTVLNTQVIKEKNYWTGKLKGELARSSFPYDFVHMEPGTDPIKETSFAIPVDLSQKLISLSNQSDKNLFVLLLTGLTILLNRYSGNDDIMIGTSILKQETEGEFLNTVLVMRNRLDNQMSFKELLIQVKATVKEANENPNYPVKRLLEHLDIRKTSNSFPLFDTVILLENIHNEEYVKSVDSNIIFSFMRSEDGIHGTVKYKSALFRQETVERITTHFISLMSECFKNINAALKDVGMLSDEEWHKLVFEFNNTAIPDIQKSKTIKEIFEEQVNKTPHHNALVFKGEKMTYECLNKRANQLARVLKNEGIGPDSIVGIMVEHSMEMMIGILGVLKAGGAFLPIDPRYPQERVEYMLEDCDVSILLTQAKSTDIGGFCGKLYNLEDKGLYQGDDTDLTSAGDINTLAYVIYTSGTTGLPKGVMIENKGLVNYATWFAGENALTAEDKTILLSSYCFDLGYTSLFPSVLSGCELHIIPREFFLEPDYLIDYIQKNSITYIKTTPSLFNVIVNGSSFMSGRNCASLRLVVLGGERIILPDIERFRSLYPDCAVMNHYGPTETTVGAVFNKIDFTRIEAYKRNPVIGRPIDNTKVYILDQASKSVPIGVIGEIYIAGSGLARGYINRNELTREKFVVKSVSGQEEKLYKTGDLGKYLPDGTIDFMGRTDHQVKIKGFRVELGEIEKQLVKYEAVREAAVIDKEDANGNRFICAYVVKEKEVTAAGLREYLQKILPEYMVPSFFVMIDKIPLTQNGKLDRRALPEVQENVRLDEFYEAPRNDIEDKIVQVWEDVLGLKNLGINHSYFELGGDSIKAIQITSRLQKHQLKLEIKDLFEHPVIKELSDFVKQVGNKADQSAVEGEVELTPIQMKFFSSNFTDMHHWNQAVMLYNRNGFDEHMLKTVFVKIVEQHDALRMVYKKEGEKVIQHNRGLDGRYFDFVVFDLRNESNSVERIENLAGKIQGSMDLEKGPLVKLGLFKCCDGDHLLIAIHHLVIDGVSWRIIFEDLALGYNQLLKGEEVELQEKSNSFKEWASELRKYADSKELLKEIGYWSSMEQVEVAKLPKDALSCENRIKDGLDKVLELSSEQTGHLLKQANKAYNTEITDILLTALGMTVNEWTGRDKILVRLEGHGREKLASDLDLSRTIGWFTSECPVILDMDNSGDIPYQIKQVKEKIRNIPKKGVGYGILKYVTSSENKYSMKFNLKPEISFNYLGQFDQDIKSDIFELSKVSPGYSMSPDSEREYALYINGMIVEGRLKMTFTLNRNEYSEDTMARLIEDYKRYLDMLTEHCMKKDDTELTPSDMGNKDISIEDLQDINDFFGNL